METQVNVRDLEAFCAVVEKGSVTAAAAASGETKGSLSRRVSRLERVLGMSLLQRVGGPAQATSEGMMYYRRASEALDILSGARAELNNQQENPAGHLRLTATPGLAESMKLGELIGAFSAEYPGITLEMILTEKMLSFREDQIDFAFRMVSEGLPDSGHKSRVLSREGIAFAASADYLEKYGVPCHPSDLDSHRLLVPESYGGGVTLSLQPKKSPEGKQKFCLRGYVYCQDLRFLISAAVGGGGITLIQPSVLEDYKARGALCEVLPDWEISSPGEFCLVYPGRPLSPKMRVFRDFILEAFPGLPSL